MSPRSWPCSWTAFLVALDLVALDLHVGEKGDQGMRAHRHEGRHIEHDQRIALLRAEREADREAPGVGNIVSPRRAIMGQGVERAGQADELRPDRWIVQGVLGAAAAEPRERG